MDAGVHNIAQHINDAGEDDYDVNMISTSGGLSDEMIPPEMCDVPPTNNAHSDKEAGLFVSDAFLASSISQSGSSSTSKGHYGMDHCAIVWCYDLLKVVCEVLSLW